MLPRVATKRMPIGLGGLDAVVQPHAVGVKVEVVAAGGAAAQQQLGHRHPAADLHHLGRQASQIGYRAAQPAEQLGVLRLREWPASGSGTCGDGC